MTIQNLLDMVDRLYPNAESNADKVANMNLAQEDISPYFGVIVEDDSLKTVANDDEYSLPTGLNDVSDIIALGVGLDAPDTNAIIESTAMIVGAYTIDDQPEKIAKISVTHTTVGSADTLGTIVIVGTVNSVAATETITPVADSTVYGTKYFDIDGITSITGVDWVTDGDDDTIEVGVSSSRYDFARYSFAKVNEDPMVWNSYYQVIDSAGTKKLAIYPVPSTDDLPIVIRLRSRLPALSTSVFTGSPAFDSNYHSMLAYFCIAQLAGAGDSPNEPQHNRFMRMYEGKLDEVWRKAMDDEIDHRTEYSDNPQWHNRKRFVRGY